MTGETTDLDAWLAWRREGVTATEVADAANGTYGGAYSVVARKLDLIDVEETPQMTRGHRWQPIIADAVHVLTGWHVVGEETWCEHGDNPRWRATVDGFLAPNSEATLDEVVGLVEIKTTGVGVRPNRQRWADQVQWQLFVTGAKTAIIAEATIDDERDALTRLAIHHVDADPDRQAFLQIVAERIAAHVDAGTLPTPDTPSALPDVKAATTLVAVDADTVDLTDLASDVERFAAIRESIKAVSDEAAELEARIRAAVGDSTVGTCAGFTVSISRPTMTLTAEGEAEILAAHPDLAKTVLDRTRAKAEHPDDYAAARRAVGARRLTIKEIRD